MHTAADLVERGVSETLTYYAFPDIHWQKIRTNNPLERIMKEIRRRTRVVGAFPDGQSCLNRWGEPELNSFFKNNPVQSSARKLPTKSCSYSQDDHRRSAVWKPTARHFEYVPKFAVYQGKRIETTIQPTAANALQEGHTFGGRGYANMPRRCQRSPRPSHR